jgi:hypothetical protein
MIKNTLVFSIALNGYQWRYRQHLASHLRFANKYNYHYQVVTRPFISKLGVECCWLKLTLMQAALNAGYHHVVFLDADAFVQAECPAISSILRANKYLYMAKGYSSRFNSGVMIVKNNAKIRAWLTQVIDSRNHSVKADNEVGWGENGHIIEHSHHCDFIYELPQVWNNTYSTSLVDFIRHQNCGPLRTNLLDNLFHKVIFSLAHRSEILVKCIALTLRLKRPKVTLLSETEKILAIYPHFSSVMSQD